MGALTVADLQPIGAEPHVLDRRLADGLGYSRSREIRGLIAAHEAELRGYGPLISTRPTAIGPKGGRPEEAYLLNEHQALLVCMFARTPKAAEIRRQVIEVFMAWRRQELAPVAPPADPFASDLEHLRQRLERLERLGIQTRDGDQEAMALELTHAGIFGGPKQPGKRPRRWFSDLEVRAYILRTHRQASLGEVLAEIVERFGVNRTPSRSSLHRAWQALDKLRTRRHAS